ncbi:hypothetical protein RJ492_005528 [Pluralibacter gergoviae]|uniref:Uncharacterized protein n=1 Tax=Pluralibacter gergoviae TaxID=61647 RepID=A0AAI9DRL9_PLUGE|nr:hypothetical protein [Pluralibacter gergoviae]EKV0918317.1 hypothetical protein [Pluralibacter gergoviae]EKV9911211.1 hypothetical protein [Pluralibacter gergoviae]EKW7277141.1 hypothetical protein [Pluralibacter gergoviae]ELD4298648.1 hypothetical protein [Pluralibacter gergoviae]ELD4309420.1 hypothetical protein [Pluralibacter gergoviae]
MHFLFKRISILSYLLLCISTIVPITTFSIASAAQVQSTVNAADFSLTINNQKVSLENSWNDLIKKRLGAQESEAFVGDVPVGNSIYKYYQHNYSGFSIYTSNLEWDKQHRDVDTYIIAQITIDSPEIKTSRGVKVGTSKDVLVRKYGKGTVDTSDEQYWIYYDGEGKRISFQIEGGKVSHIMMVINPDD